MHSKLTLSHVLKTFGILLCLVWSVISFTSCSDDDDKYFLRENCNTEDIIPKIESITSTSVIFYVPELGSYHFWSELVETSIFISYDKKELEKMIELSKKNPYIDPVDYSLNVKRNDYTNPGKQKAEYRDLLPNTTYYYTVYKFVVQAKQIMTYDIKSFKTLEK